MTTKKTTLSIRLDDEQLDKVKEIAAKFRVGEADVIRWAIDALVEYVAHHDGHLHLPIQFDVLWAKVTAAAPAEARDDLPMIAETVTPYKVEKRRAS
jgi:Ribbon-helix-helix protein, copG family